MKLIVRTVAGSKLYGLSHPDSDSDVRGVYVDPTDSLIGLAPPAQSMELSGPGDEQLYPLKHFAHLSLSGNPNALEILFTPHEFVIESSADWAQLFVIRYCFLSKKLIERYTGFMRHQVTRIKTRNPGTTHQKFIDAYGYDTKSAAHCIRVGLTAMSLARSMDYSPVLEGKDLTLIKDILHGQVSQEKFNTLAKSMIDEIRAVPTPLPDEPNSATVTEVVTDILFRNVRNDMVYAIKTL